MAASCTSPAARTAVSSRITRSPMSSISGRRVTDFDDAPAFQAAVDSLVDTGGVVWFPPGKTYRISSSIDIRSHFPIFLESRMKMVPGMVNLCVPATLKQAIIKPVAPITSGAMFHSVAPGWRNRPHQKRRRGNDWDHHCRRGRQLLFAHTCDRQRRVGGVRHFLHNPRVHFLAS